MWHSTEIRVGVSATSDPSPAAREDTPAAEADETLCEERDRYLELARRSQADLENYRRRAAREIADARTRGVADAVGEVLGAADTLDRIIAADDETDPGVQALHRELHSALGRLGVTMFDPAGEPFDPADMEALATSPAEEENAGTVVQVHQLGYRLGDRVLRPARVVVAS